MLNQNPPVLDNERKNGCALLYEECKTMKNPITQLKRKLTTRFYYWCRGTVNIEKLKKKGLKIGDNFYYREGAYIDPSHCFLISIGNNSGFSSNVTVLAHDSSPFLYTGYTKIGQVHIGDKVFIGANVTILPGVTIGDNVVIGAGSVISRDIPSNEVWAGNPARRLCSLDEYLARFEKTKRFDKSYRVSASLSEEKKKELIAATANGFALIE